MPSVDVHATAGHVNGSRSAELLTSESATALVDGDSWSVAMKDEVQEQAMPSVDVHATAGHVNGSRSAELLQDSTRGH
jgi:hypothetical protein